MAKITAELTTGTVVRMSNGRHTWTADEPLDKGGTDAQVPHILKNLVLVGVCVMFYVLAPRLCRDVGV